MAKVYLLCLVLGCLAHADQVNCIKWKDIAGNTVGTYCKPFSVRAGSGVQFSDDGMGRITITGTAPAPGAGGADTQVNFNSAGTLDGSAGLTWNDSTSTLTATNITGLNRRPFLDMIRDCGLVGYPTDDAAAANACFLLYPGWHFYFPQLKTDGSCSYKFNSTLVPQGAGTRISGSSGGYSGSNTALGGTVLCWAAGITAFEFDLTGPNCSSCTIENISLLGSEGTNHLSSPTLANFPSGVNLPRYTRTITAIQRASNVLTVNTARVVSIEGLTQQVGSTIKISGVVSDSTMNGNCVVATLVTGGGTATNPTQFTCAQNGSDAGPFAEGTTGLPTTGASTADGIRVCTNFLTVRQVTIGNFGRHGVNADSGDGMCPSAFSDDLILENSVLVGNQGDGYLCYGTDCNAHLLSGNAVYSNTLWGLHDQSSLGNTHTGNQLSNGGHQWAGSSTPSTKNISTISRSLSGGISTVTVVLSAADANLKLGSCVVIAGVADTSFTTATVNPGGCYFITSYTDSTHFQYEQPGAPTNASSSGGTSRMAKWSEVYLASGVDDGAAKIQTQSAVAQNVVTNEYIEGGQACKFGTSTILIGGANIPGCASTGDWIGSFITTQGVVLGGAAGFASNLNGFANNKDVNNALFFRGGTTGGSVRHFFFRWMNNNTSTDSWGLDVDPTGAAGTSGTWILGRGTAGSTVRRLSFFGDTNATGITRINSESSGAVEINNDSGSGSGGLKVCDGAGNCITLNSATASTVGSAGAASALPATPSGYLIFKVGSTNFKLPYYAN